jgi:Long-chain acyl-CoA synthetases (AMP-forming)
MDLNKINSLTELFFCQYEKQKNKDKILLSSLKEPRKNYSWQQTFDLINKLSDELKKYVIKGDRCLLISENRPEWFITDFAIMLSETITVPAYTTYAEKDYEYIINDCKPSVIFVSNMEQFKKVKNIINNKDFVKKIFSFDVLEEINEDQYININNLILNNKNNNFKTKITRKDAACIIYTSGTQGNPKGVILSHGGILNNCEGAIEILKPLLKTDQTRFLTWLPLSHSYEHTVQFVQITVDARVFYAESIDKLIKNMNDCSPEIMTAVPRFYKNFIKNKCKF